MPDLEKDQRTRFHQSVSREARALSEVAKTLIGEFDREVVDHHTISPMREVDDLIIDELNYFPKLEELSDLLRSEVYQFGRFDEISLERALKSKFSVRVERSVDLSKGADVIPGQFRYDHGERLMQFRGNCTMSTRQFQLARL